MSRQRAGSINMLPGIDDLTTSDFFTAALDFISRAMILGYLGLSQPQTADRFGYLRPCGKFWISQQISGYLRDEFWISQVVRPGRFVSQLVVAQQESCRIHICLKRVMLPNM